jgi:hypothetical protein
MKKLIVLIGAAAIAVAPVVFAHEGEEHEAQKEITVKGEVIDIACYVEHNGSGEKHIACAKMCMENGLPVGIKANDGKTYLLVGDHKSLNKELVEFAGKTITMKGHAVSRDGINLIADAEIVK